MELLNLNMVINAWSPNYLFGIGIDANVDG